MKKGILFVISAPSGTGKTTLLKNVMARIPGLNFSVSHTTRKARSGEQDGNEYFFVTRQTFTQMIDQELFLEWAEVHDNLYGTSILAVSKQLDSGQDVILDIDVQGAKIVSASEKFSPVRIFIAPPDLTELERRLRGRGTEAEESLQLRLANAKEEMQAAASYDYLVVNNILDEAAEALAAIIMAERSRAHRLPGGQPVVLDGLDL